MSAIIRRTTAVLVTAVITATALQSTAMADPDPDPDPDPRKCVHLDDDELICVAW